MCGDNCGSCLPKTLYDWSIQSLFLSCIRCIYSIGDHLYHVISATYSSSIQKAGHVSLTQQARNSVVKQVILEIVEDGMLPKSEFYSLFHCRAAEKESWKGVSGTYNESSKNTTMPQVKYNPILPESLCPSIYRQVQTRVPQLIHIFPPKLTTVGIKLTVPRLA